MSQPLLSLVSDVERTIPRLKGAPHFPIGPAARLWTPLRCSIVSKIPSLSDSSYFPITSARSAQDPYPEEPEDYLIERFPWGCGNELEWLESLPPPPVNNRCYVPPSTFVLDWVKDQQDHIIVLPTRSEWVVSAKEHAEYALLLSSVNIPVEAQDSYMTNVMRNMTDVAFNLEHIDGGKHRFWNESVPVPIDPEDPPHWSVEEATGSWVHLTVIEQPKPEPQEDASSPSPQKRVKKRTKIVQKLKALRNKFF